MPNPFALHGKKILITGASSGIGKSTAIEASKLGAKIILVGRRVDELKNTFAQLLGEGHKVEPFDLSSGSEIVGWILKLGEQFGPIDGLVHSAGESLLMPIRSISEIQYRKIMSINLDAAYWLTKGFRQKKVKSTSSSVVFISSVSGSVGNPGLTAYCASKSALIGLAKSSALELAKEGVRVNVVSPALIDTAMASSYALALTEEEKTKILETHPLGMGAPEDVAFSVIYLLSNASKWVTGANLAIDGGYTAK